MQEVFKDIKYEENYQISNLGRVYSKKSKKYLKINICNGYERTQIKTKMYLIHRLIAEHFLENPNNKPFVDHINRNKLDNSIENLRWVTRNENAKNRAFKNYQVAINYGHKKYKCQINTEDGRFCKLFPFNKEGLEELIKWRANIHKKYFKEYSPYTEDFNEDTYIKKEFPNVNKSESLPHKNIYFVSGKFKSWKFAKVVKGKQFQKYFDFSNEGLEKAIKYRDNFINTNKC